MSSHIETAAQIQNTLKSTVAAVRSDPTLSDAGKTQRLTQAYQEAAGKMAAAKQAHTAAVEAERESLQKSVFGLSFTMSATDAERAAAQAMYRDAIDRTAALKTEQDALNMIETANLTGDRTLLKAASLSAYRNGWGKALARYAEIEPDAGRRVYALQDQDVASRDPMQRFGESVAFSLDKPAEVDMNAEYRPVVPAE